LRACGFDCETNFAAAAKLCCSAGMQRSRLADRIGNFLQNRINREMFTLSENLLRL
jgi:hypothetical protein